LSRSHGTSGDRSTETRRVLKPIPVVFHIGPLAVHTYGIGLAITFWFGYRYFARRLRDHGYPSAWLGVTFLWVLIASIVGARAAHVIANLGYYTRNPADSFEIWHGGLSSFGGLILGIPVGFASARRRCPTLKMSVAADLVTPVLLAAWAVGRLLGPQVEVAGGGKQTSAWFGMYYAGEVGKRLPVPIFQALECFAVYLIALRVERFVSRHRGPVGLVTAVGVGLWGLSRFFDEYFWLTHDNGTLAIEVTAVVLFVLTMAVSGWLLARHRRSPLPESPRQTTELPA
jgi:phosphatidylglycerol---prolipoprotein diacylglyceryl transferase